MKAYGLSEVTVVWKGGLVQDCIVARGVVHYKGLTRIFFQTPIKLQGLPHNHVDIKHSLIKSITVEEKLS
jgi:hypothetical protein